MYDNLVSLFFDVTLVKFNLNKEKSVDEIFMVENSIFVENIKHDDKEIELFLKYKIEKCKIPSALYIKMVCSKENRFNLYGQILQFEIPLVIYNKYFIYQHRHMDIFLQMIIALS